MSVPGVPEISRVDVPGRQSVGDLARRLSKAKWFPAIATSVVLLIVGGIVSPGYATWSNINVIAVTAAILALASCGQTLVMISGNYGIDLSVGQVMSLTAVVAYMILGHGSALLPVAVLGVLAVGAAIGLVNGSLVAFVRLPALVVTLGTLVVAEGAIFALSGGGSPSGAVPNLLVKLTTQGILGVRYVTLLAIVVIAGVALFIKRSRYGKELYLVGSSREAARLSGLPVNRIVLTTFILASMLAGFAGLILLGYAGTANLDLGGDYLLLSIAATVIGGTSLAGGDGSVLCSAAGAFAFEVLTTFLLTIGVDSALRQVLTGALLLVLLAFNARIPRLRS